MKYSREVYACKGAADKLELSLYEGLGHAYLATMVEAMIGFFRRHL